MEKTGRINVIETFLGWIEGRFSCVASFEPLGSPLFDRIDSTVLKNAIDHRVPLYLGTRLVLPVVGGNDALFGLIVVEEKVPMNLNQLKTLMNTISHILVRRLIEADRTDQGDPGGKETPPLLISSENQYERLKKALEIHESSHRLLFFNLDLFKHSDLDLDGSTIYISEYTTLDSETLGKLERLYINLPLMENPPTLILGTSLSEDETLSHPTFEAYSVIQNANKHRIELRMGARSNAQVYYLSIGRNSSHPLQ